MSRKVRVLGIDPGLQHTGWGIVDMEGNRLSYVDCGVISPPTKQEFSDRLLQLHSELTGVISMYGPQQAGIEETFVNKNPATSLKPGRRIPSSTSGRIPRRAGSSN